MKHIAVIGDLYIDHDIFVTEERPREESGEQEPRYNVIRRQDTAGGAANCARILSVLNDGGATYLWGLLGTSHWGSFRSILEKSHSIDDANRPVELRGVTDETGAPMNTVTRLLVVDPMHPDVVKKRGPRFQDIDHVHMPDAKRNWLLYHLRGIQEKTQLDAIVVNEFRARSTLTKRLMSKVAHFAIQHKIPIFVDPAENSALPENVEMTAILPNLEEWCALVGDKGLHSPKWWKENLDKEQALCDMARVSLFKFRNFTYHVIKCDDQGAVLIFPLAKHQYGVYHAAPVPATAKPQTGCGDVMTAVFALEFPYNGSKPKDVLLAFQRANAAVGAYRDTRWHRMPAKNAVFEKEDKYGSRLHLLRAQTTESVRFLPKNGTIAMNSFETCIPGLYSQDHEFRRRLVEFIQDITGGWTGRVKSLVLGAKPGTGKSAILLALPKIARGESIATVDMSATKEDPLHKLDPKCFGDKFREMRDQHERVWVLVDEAVKDPTGRFLRKNGVPLLEAAHEHGVRFVFASQEFTRELQKKAPWAELFGRMKAHHVPDLEKRLADIPLIVASTIFRLRPELGTLRIDAGFLVQVIDRALSNYEARVAEEPVNELLNKVLRRSTTPRRRKTAFEVKRDDLLPEYRVYSKFFGIYEFHK